MHIAAEWVFPISTSPLRRHTIEFENGRIGQIRPMRDSDEFFPNTVLMPGLVNAHTHLAYTGMRNRFDHLDFFPWIRALTEFKKLLTEEEIVASTQLGINECLRAGITTVADMCDMEPALRTLAQSPLRGIFYWEVFGVERDMADRAWSDLQNTYPRLKDTYQTGRLQIGISPHSCYTVRPELYAQIAEWAIRDGIPISFHLSESTAEEQFIAERKGPIAEFLRSRIPDWKIDATSAIAHLEKTGIFSAHPLLAHLVQAAPTDLQRLHRHDVGIAHCPKSNSKFGHGIAPLKDFIDMGFQVGIGTDSAASNNRLDLFEESRFALLQQRSRLQSAVFSESDVLQWMTLDGAKALKLDQRIGSLDPGKEADFILVNVPEGYQSASQVLNHLVHTTTSNDVSRTYIGGHQVSLEDAPKALKKLLSRP